jgi:hypothetical protein
MRETLERNNNKLTEAQARDVIDRCMKLLYYRDGRAYDRVSVFFCCLKKIIKSKNVDLKFTFFVVLVGCCHKRWLKSRRNETIGKQLVCRRKNIVKMPFFKETLIVLTMYQISMAKITNEK